MRLVAVLKLKIGFSANKKSSRLYREDYINCTLVFTCYLNFFWVFIILVAMNIIIAS